MSQVRDQGAVPCTSTISTLSQPDEGGS